MLVSIVESVPMEDIVKVYKKASYIGRRILVSNNHVLIYNLRVVNLTQRI